MKMYYIKPAADLGSQRRWSAFGREIDLSQLDSKEPLALLGLGERGEIVTPSISITLDEDRCVTDDKWQGEVIWMRNNESGETTRVTWPGSSQPSSVGFEQQGNTRVPMLLIGFGGEVFPVRRDSSGWLANIGFGEILAENDTGISPPPDRVIAQIKQSVPYFVRDSDGAFVKKDATAGLTVRCAILGKRADETLSLKWKSVIMEATERATIEGVSLAIGEPKIATRECEETFDIPIRNWSIVLYRAADGGHIMNLIYGNRHR